MHAYRLTLSLTAALALGACGSMNTASNDNATNAPVQQSAPAGTAYPGYGVVDSIELLKADKGGIGGSGIGIGTIAGTVIGGIVGNQIGSGRGNTAATVIGAAGGAYAGHELDKREQPQADAYRMRIRMDNGNIQTVTQNLSAEIRAGDRVQIDNAGTVRRY